MAELISLKGHWVVHRWITLERIWNFYRKAARNPGERINFVRGAFGSRMIALNDEWTVNLKCANPSEVLYKGLAVGVKERQAYLKLIVIHNNWIQSIEYKTFNLKRFVENIQA